MRARFAVILIVAASVVPAAAAEDSDVSEITSRVRGFYAAWSAGDVATAFNQIGPGSGGFLGNGGLLTTIPDAQAHQAIVAQYQVLVDGGVRVNLIPKHITVTVSGDAAVAAFYLEGSVTDISGQTESVLNRASLVWSRADGQWRILHWHISTLEAG